MLKVDLPFYYKSHDLGDNGGKPHTLPFSLVFDSELELVKQEPSDQLSAILEQVYVEGSLVDGSISSESGLHYVQPILDYIYAHTNLSLTSNIVEIGFGEGLFLKKLKEAGFSNLVGIEPGNHRICDGLEDVRLIFDFYPSKQFTEEVDLIFHSLVLEHIQDPVIFLQSQRQQLTENGKIVLVVPNEEPFLAEGDCSSFIHEHYNFFTARSLMKVVHSAGMFIEDLTIIGGLIAVTLTKSISKSNLIFHSNFDFKKYLATIDENVRKMRQFVDSYDVDSDIAVYVPGRALNLMCLVGNAEALLVDDNSEVHNKYLPFFKRPVESFESILNNPPKAILIFSRTFADKIKEKCRNHTQLSLCKLIAIDDL